jgi:inner membrane protein
LDSLSQIVLGAAVGEVVLGKKLGNRAVLWGAIAGTIPDLDVMAGPLISEIDGLAFHRGPTHSLLFSVLGSFLFGYLAHLFYIRKMYNALWVKWIHVGVLSVFLLVPGIFFLNQSVDAISGIIVIISAISLYFLIRYGGRKHVSNHYHFPPVSYAEWIWLFFAGFLTHILLDCFTTYGTQCLWPFFDTRVAWNTISVVDPLYTLPFLVCLIIAMRFSRSDARRRWWNYAGLLISTSYLFWTVYAKSVVDHKLTTSLMDNSISSNRLHSTPTIFNNLLWYALAETDNGYFYTYYSLLDNPSTPLNWNYVPRCYDASLSIKEVPILHTLSWFSDNYYVMDRDSEGDFIWRDLRFGNMDFMGRRSDISNFIFYFKVSKSPRGIWDIEQRRPEMVDFKGIFMDLWTRMQGK